MQVTLKDGQNVFGVFEVTDFDEVENNQSIVFDGRIFILKSVYEGQMVFELAHGVLVTMIDQMQFNFGQKI